MLSASTGGSLFKTSRTDIEGRLAAFSFREASSCEARARRGDCRPGNAARIKKATGAYASGSWCGAQGKRHVFCASPSVPIRAASRWPLRVFVSGNGVEAGPVRNLKERWGVGTEGCREYFIGVFGKAAEPFFYKRNFEVIIKCINRQLRIR